MYEQPVTQCWMQWVGALTQRVAKGSWGGGQAVPARSSPTCSDLGIPSSTTGWRFCLRLGSSTHKISGAGWATLSISTGGEFTPPCVMAVVLNVHPKVLGTNLVGAPGLARNEEAQLGRCKAQCYGTPHGQFLHLLNPETHSQRSTDTQKATLQQGSKNTTRDPSPWFPSSPQHATHTLQREGAEWTFCKRHPH